MHFQGTRLEEDHVTPILQGGDVAVEGLPFVGDDRHAAGGAELLRNFLALQGWGLGMPTDALDPLALRETLEEPNAIALGVPAVDVIEDHRSVAMSPQLAIEAKHRQVAFQPTSLA